MPVIEVKDLTKRFNSFVAVDHVSFRVDAGEIFAFLGPNGAGKSTTIKMMTTILLPTSGSIRIDGFDAQTEKNGVRESIGVIFQDHTLDDDLTAYENLNYHAILYNLPKAGRREQIEEMLGYVGLRERENELIKKFSGGMKRRVEIARGLLHSPKILFLDEPTLGLDVQTRAFLWDHIQKINRERGVTIFFTTHNMDEAERIATRIAVIDRGKILMTGTSSEIRAATQTDSLENAFLKLTGYDIREQPADNMDKMRRFRR